MENTCIEGGTRDLSWDFSQDLELSRFKQFGEIVPTKMLFGGELYKNEK